MRTESLTSVVTHESLSVNPTGCINACTVLPPNSTSNDYTSSSTSTGKFNGVCWVFDIFWTFCVSTPLVVGSWVAIFQLWDLYTGADSLSGWVSTCIGCFVCCFLALIQHQLQHMHKTNPDIYALLCPVIMTLYTFFSTTAWRGWWLLIDLYTDKNMSSALASIIAGITFHILSGTLRTSSASPPLLMCNDWNLIRTGQYCTYPTLYNTQIWRNGFPLFFVDVVYACICCTIFPTTLWRGLWLLEDLVIYNPQNTRNRQHLSYSLCIGVGLATCLICICCAAYFANTIKWLGKEVSFYLQWILFAIYNLFATIAVITYWRGLWGYCDIFVEVYFSTPEEGYLMVFFASLFFLLMFNLLSNAPTRGVITDDRYDLLDYPFSYLTGLTQTTPFPNNLNSS